MFVKAMPNVSSKFIDDHAVLTLLRAWRMEVTKADFSSEEMQTFAGSQTYREGQGGKPKGRKVPKDICYTFDEVGFKRFVKEPPQHGYLPTADGTMPNATKLVLFAKKIEKEYPKQCYVEWGQVPFFSNGEEGFERLKSLFPVKMVIGENLFERLKNRVLDCNEASTIKLLTDKNYQAAKKVRFHSIATNVKMYGLQIDTKEFENKSNKPTLICLSFFKEAYNKHAHVGLVNGKSGPVQQIYLPTPGFPPIVGNTVILKTDRKPAVILAVFPNHHYEIRPVISGASGARFPCELSELVAAPLPLGTLLAPTAPKRMHSNSAAGTPSTVEKRPRTGSVEVEVEDMDAELEQIMETDVDDLMLLSRKQPDLRVTEYRSPAFATSPRRPARSSEFFRNARWP